LIALILYGFAGGLISMLLYWLLSPQRRIRENKKELARLRRLLAAEDDEFSNVLRLSFQSLAATGKVLGLTLAPVLVAVGPVLLLIVWVESEYSKRDPVPGDQIQISVRPEDDTEITGPGIRKRDGGWEIIWPDRSFKLRVSSETGDLVLAVDEKEPFRHAMVNSRLANLLKLPYRKLPADGPIQRVSLGLPSREFLSFGPRFVREWYFPFFLSMLVASLGTKVAFRIH
jgi:hypothetical protein